MTKGGTNKL